MGYKSPFEKDMGGGVKETVTTAGKRTRYRQGKRPPRNVFRKGPCAVTGKRREERAARKNRDNPKIK